MNPRYKFGNIYNVIVLIVFSFILFWSAYNLSKNFLEDKAYDFLVKITAKTNPSKDIVVVAIDDQSINKIGRWPWKRTNYTDIFEYLENYGQAKIIVFDSIISSYGDKNDDETFFKRLSKLDKVVSGIFFSKQKAFFINSDNINPEQTERLFKEKFSIKIDDTRNTEFITNSEYYNSSYTLNEIMNSLSGLGSVLSNPDKDGVIRKAEPVFYYKNAYYPSLALAVFNKLYPHSQYKLSEKSFASHYYGKNPVNIPLYSNKTGSFSYIKWCKTDDKSNVYPYKTISASKIIDSYNSLKNGKQPVITQEDLKDKIVIIGVTATALKDVKSTPMAADYPGVYIQATIIDNFLNNEFIKMPSKAVKLLVISIITVLTVLIVLTLPALYSAILSIILALSYFSFCLFVAYPKNYALDAITPIIFIFCSMLIGYGYNYFIENRRKSEIKNLIAKYVSKDILDVILSDVDSAKLGGKHADISVLFADIRNFTTISDTIEPEEVSSILNEYFGEIIPIIFDYKGTVNKFIGDAILVIFGAPVENSEHPKMAVKCAVEMLEKSKELQEKWLKENKPLIDIGIGISSGIAFVGNIGSDERHEYSAIGNTVNTANRLESFNKLYKTNILISEQTYERVKDIIEADEVDSVCITQNSEPIKIYEVKALIN